jgi:3',5'-cyclic AMP phosphodiesterase CpdA
MKIDRYLSFGRGMKAAAIVVFAAALGPLEAAGAAPQGGKPSTELWFPDSAYDESAVRDFRIGPLGSFRILVLSDIQLEANPFKDPKSLSILASLVREAKPDLILTTGDNSAGPFSRMRAKKLVSVMEKLGPPWGVVLGNHDSEGGADRPWLGKLYGSAGNSVFREGPSTIHGVGNYSLNIRDREGRIAYCLVLLDSNSMRIYPDGRKGYDLVYPDQIAWYEWLVRGVSAARYGAYDPGTGKVVPSFLVMHIPVPEFTDAIGAWERGELDDGPVFGVKNEEPCVPYANSGLFGAALLLGSTTDILVGHDHVNNVSLPWKGIRLTYGTKTGPGSYSRPDLQGGTLITIHEEDGKYIARTEHLYGGR